MKINIIISIFVISPFFAGCITKQHKDLVIEKETHQKTVTQILHLPSQGKDTLNVSYFADTVLYVPLETTQASLIKNIEKIWTNDSLILINSNNQELMLFDIKGKFIRKIGQIGRGPGEYARILSFDVINDTIYISSTGRNGLLRFKLDGTFCDEIKFNYQPAYISSTTDNKLVCYDWYIGKVLVYNSNFDKPDTITVEYGVTEGRYLYGYFEKYFTTYLQKTSSGLLFNNYVSDTVWNIRNGNKEATYIFDTKDKLLPYEKQVEFCGGNVRGWGEVTLPYHIPQIIQFSSYMIILQTHWGENKYNAIYLRDFETGETERFNTSFIYDDIVGKQKFEFVFHTYSDNYLVTFTESFDVLKNIRQNNGRIIDPPTDLWIKQMETVNESEDNDILAFIKVKNIQNE